MTIRQVTTALGLCVFMLSITPPTVADEAAPKPLFIVHFETGENWDPALEPAKQQQFQQHSANLNRLRTNGSIVFGARYADFGMIILESRSLQAATSLIAADPGVQAGIFDFRIEPISVFYDWKK